jgi:hypothetical protein
MIVAERGRKARCTNCEWSGPQSQAVERDGTSQAPAPAAAG